MTELYPLINRIIELRNEIPANRAVLAALSGIDGGGKGYVTAKLVEALESRGLRVASINVDGWLNLTHVRIGHVIETRPEHFYLNAIRFTEMFEQLIVPLRENRSIDVETDFTIETEPAYQRHRYLFKEIDVIVLEGIFLLKREFQPVYDIRCWVNCSFETALKRAVARGQEGLPPEETEAAYLSIYQPAQRIYFERDNPKGSADFIIKNDDRPEGAGAKVDRVQSVQRRPFVHPRAWVRDQGGERQEADAVAPLPVCVPRRKSIDASRHFGHRIGP